MSLHHPLPTPRVRFRLWSPQDRREFRRMNGNPRVMEYFPSPLSARASDALLERLMTHQEKEGFGVWPIELAGAPARRNETEPEGVERGNAPGAPAFMGFVGLLRVRFAAPFVPAVEIGWRLLPEFWGRGYATEAARACLAFGFATLGLPEVVAFTTPANRRSRRVMERVGMLHDPADDFDHPGLPDEHPLRRHVLYRLERGV